MTNLQLIAEFEKMPGWRYEWGAARQGCVDCSGAFVYAMKLHGLSIYHGSNTIWRQWLTEKGKMGEIAMIPGMAVFKRRTGMDGTDDFYHMGLYIAPNQVIEAKSAALGVVRSTLSGWTHAGRVRGIAYEEVPIMNPPYQAKVQTAGGGGIAIWTSPDNAGSPTGLPRAGEGTIVRVDSHINDRWAQAKGGYLQRAYLVPVVDDSVSVPREKLIAIYEAVGALL